MGFLAPVVPFIGKGIGALAGALGGKAALGKAALGVGTSLLGSKLSGGSGGIKDTSGLLESQRGAIEQGRQIAGGLEPQAQNLLSMATRSYSPVANYYGRLLSGNRESAMQALSPEIQQINAGYGAAAKSAELQPRGGGRSAFFADLPYQRNRDVTNLLMSARPQGAEGLLRTGSTAAGTSQGLYSTLLSALSGAGAGTAGLLNYDLQSRADQYTKGKELGRTIFDLLQGLNFGGSGKSKNILDIPGIGDARPYPSLPGNIWNPPIAPPRLPS